MNGIFCLEGAWNGDLPGPTSVRPILSLLGEGHPDRTSRIPYYHATCATTEELFHYLGRWGLKKHRRYTILYLAFHGQAGSVVVGNEVLSLDDLADALVGRCAGRVVVFGTCSTLAIDKRYLKRFLALTEAAAVCGYRTDVAWVQGTAFEMMLLDIMQRWEFSGPGLIALERAARKAARSFGRDLQFRIVTRLE